MLSERLDVPHPSNPGMDHEPDHLYQVATASDDRTREKENGTRLQSRNNPAIPPSEHPNIRTSHLLEGCRLGLLLLPGGGRVEGRHRLPPRLEDRTPAEFFQILSVAAEVVVEADVHVREVVDIVLSPGTGKGSTTGEGGKARGGEGGGITARPSILCASGAARL